MRLCADVGGSFIDIAAFDDAAQIVWRRKTPTPVADWAAFVAAFADAVRAVQCAAGQELKRVSCLPTAGGA